MLERLQLLWKGLSLLLAALLLVQIARLFVRRDSFAAVSMSVSEPAADGPAIAGTSGPRDTNPAAPPVPGAGVPGLPPPLQARVSRIVESEILGPVQRPLPMALLGIGGRHAFLRAPNGMTGLLREGEVLGTIKLLRIGTNRVLIELDGQCKELTLFAGFGGETLMPQPKESPQ